MIPVIWSKLEIALYTLFVLSHPTELNEFYRFDLRVVVRLNKPVVLHLNLHTGTYSGFQSGETYISREAQKSSPLDSFAPFTKRKTYFVRSVKKDMPTLSVILTPPPSLSLESSRMQETCCPPVYAPVNVW